MLVKHFSEVPKHKPDATDHLYNNHSPYHSLFKIQLLLNYLANYKHLIKTWPATTTTIIIYTTPPQPHKQQHHTHITTNIINIITTAT